MAAAGQEVRKEARRAPAAVRGRGATGAQMLKVMKRTVDVDAAVAAGNFAPIHRWLTERIWSKGCLYDPADILAQSLG